MKPSNYAFEVGLHWYQTRTVSRHLHIHWDLSLWCFPGRQDLALLFFQGFQMQNNSEMEAGPVHLCGSLTWAINLLRGIKLSWNIKCCVPQQMSMSFPEECSEGTDLTLRIILAWWYSPCSQEICSVWNINQVCHFLLEHTHIYAYIDTYR